jgi:hypothetical protein
MDANLSRDFFICDVIILRNFIFLYEIFRIYY